MEKKTEAKEKNEIRMASETDFYALIEKKMEQQGYELVETMSAHKGKNKDTVLEYRLINLFAS